MTYISGIDTSWVNRDFTPSGVSFTIINASRANDGGLDVGSYYHTQVDNARSAHVEVGHYFFNGDGNGHDTPTDCAIFFVANLYDFRPGDALVIDVEYEESTNTSAWTPAQVMEFAQKVYELTGVKVGVYLNLSLIKGSDWSAVVAFGCWLWVAWPGDESDIVTGAWDEWTMWQYTVIDNLDRNYSKQHIHEISGGGDELTPEQDSILRAIHDALFKTSQVSAETTGGNAIPGGTLRTLSALYDAAFLTAPTSLGTPGGELTTLKAILDRLEAIEQKLGVEITDTK